MEWPPEQIMHYCARNKMPVASHGRNYKCITKDKKEGGKLYTHLRHKLKYRKRIQIQHKTNKRLRKKLDFILIRIYAIVKVTIAFGS